MTRSETIWPVAVLAADGFEEAELFSPKAALEAAGAEVRVVSQESGEIEANQHRKQGRTISVDDVLEEADPGHYRALLVPGGLFSPDALRIDSNAREFVRGFFDAGKPVGAICHGPQVLIDAQVVAGRRMTGVKNIRTDLENAEANVVDEPVVVDENLVTSRTPGDLEAFNAALVEAVFGADAVRR